MALRSCGLDDIIEILEVEGYIVEVHEVDGLKHGMPQHRQRLYIVAVHFLLAESEDAMAFKSKSKDLASCYVAGACLPVLWGFCSSCV